MLCLMLSRSSGSLLRVKVRNFSQIETYVKMSDRVRTASARFAGKSFHEALLVPLNFKLCTTELQLVEQHPNLFDHGPCEYKAKLDVFFQGESSQTINSVSTIHGRDNLFFSILKSMIPRAQISENQSTSSDPIHAGHITSIGGALGLLHERHFDDETLAIEQLVESLNVTLFSSVLPKGITSIPALITTQKTIALYSIQYNETKTFLTHTPLRSYYFPSAVERILFMTDYFKLMCWLNVLPKPTHPGTLLPGVKLDTSNKHTVTLTKHGIIKTFIPTKHELYEHNKVTENTLKLIQSVYDAKLTNGEQGEVDSDDKRILITSIGQELKSAITSGRITDREIVIQGVRSALDQLHSIGIAHCDVCIENTFLLPDGKTIILGDLEYCRKLTDKAPKGLTRSFQRARDAQHLDELQFQDYFVDEVDKLLKRW